jgi:coproporphyrinogen III oxidase-like Fe-S oxidoreductase
MGGERFANVSDVNQYMQALKVGQRPVVPDISGVEDRMTEAIMLGLRTSRGIDRHLFAARFGRPVEEKINRNQYELFVASGHLIPDESALRLSDDGICVADEIIRRLVT